MDDGLKKFLEGLVSIVCVIVLIICHFSVPRLPFESVDYYCQRTTSIFFIIHNIEAEEACFARERLKIDRRVNLIKRIETNFKHSITSSQAECMANKIQNKLTDSQIDKFIDGTGLLYLIGSDASLELSKEMVQCQ